MAKALQHVQGLKQPIDFIINGGDAIMDALKQAKIEHRRNGICSKMFYRKKIVFRCIILSVIMMYGDGSSKAKNQITTGYTVSNGYRKYWK